MLTIAPPRPLFVERNFWEVIYIVVVLVPIILCGRGGCSGFAGEALRSKRATGYWAMVSCYCCPGCLAGGTVRFAVSIQRLSFMVFYSTVSRPLACVHFSASLVHFLWPAFIFIVYSIYPIFVLPSSTPHTSTPTHLCVSYLALFAI